MSTTLIDAVRKDLQSPELQDGMAFLFALNSMGGPLYRAYEKLCDGNNNAELTGALQEAFAAGVKYARSQNAKP